MTRWRSAVTLLLLGIIVAPAVFPILELARTPDGWQAWAEPGRVLALAWNTLGLVAGTLALALPAGIVGAVLLYRTNLPLRGLLLNLTLLSVFVPLPLFTSAWQAALGTGGWLPVAIWSRPLPGDPDVSLSGTFWKPWGQGLGAAIWVHAVAGVPWIILLVGQGLSWVERELEEEALLVVGWWRVLWRVTLPRCQSAIWAAAVWVALLAMTEITVTDIMQVRTFAEEVYTQFVAGGPESTTRAVAVSLPFVVLSAGLVLWASARWERTLPPLDTLQLSPLLIPLGRLRWPLFAIALLIGGLLLGVPSASLVWKTGLGGSPRAWSAPTAFIHLTTVVRVRGWMVLESVLLAALAGGVTASLALVVCWLAIGSRWFRGSTLGLMAIIWALAGPIIGLGLKRAIRWLLETTDSHLLAAALYYGPSPLPALWAYLIRFFPCAVAILWPVVRLVPTELMEAARVDGASPGQEFTHIVLPVMRSAWYRAAGAVAILALGELGASKLVETPGSQTFAHEVFTQMHYGITNDLAALCLILLVVVIGGGVIVFGSMAGRRRREET